MDQKYIMPLLSAPLLTFSYSSRDKLVSDLSPVALNFDLRVTSRSPL